MYTYNMMNMEIPDPFATFVAKKYKDYKGSIYDFFTGEWLLKCGACGEPLCAPTKKILNKSMFFSYSI